MLTKVVELAAVPPYGLRVRFTNGQAGTHDCSRLVLEPGPMIEPLRDPAFFARAFLELGAPSWPNGFDMPPEWLPGKCWPRTNCPQAPRKARRPG